MVRNTEFDGRTGTARPNRPAQSGLTPSLHRFGAEHYRSGMHRIQLSKSERDPQGHNSTLGPNIRGKPTTALNLFPPGGAGVPASLWGTLNFTARDGQIVRHPIAYFITSRQTCQPAEHALCMARGKQRHGAARPPAEGRRSRKKRSYSRPAATCQGQFCGPWSKPRESASGTVSGEQDRSIRLGPRTSRAGPRLVRARPR